MTFIAANLDGQSIPRIQEKALASGEDFEKGALLLVDANGDYAEVGADPAAVAAVAESAAGANTDGFRRTGVEEFPPGYMQATSVANGQPFHAEYAGTLPAAAGGSYGVVRGADGKWRVDFAETTNNVVKLVDLRMTESPINRNRVLVQFLSGVVQSV